MKIKTTAFILAVVLAVLVFSACGAGGQTASPSAAPTVSQAPSETAVTVEASASPSAPAAQKANVNVAALIGPTGIGLVQMMDSQDKGEAKNNYNFILTGTPDDIVAKITSGQADIAAVPVNLAPTLYAKTNGNVQLIAINTLGVLYVVEKGDTVKSVADLKGKTLYASGQAATPEYVINYILSKNGIDPAKDVTIQWVADHSQLASLVMAGKADLAMLPEPFVTTVTQKDPNLRVALDLTKEWNAVPGSSGNLIMGVMIVRKDFAQKNTEALLAFMDEYKASTDFVNKNVADAAALVAKYKIMASTDLAQKAIPNCNIVYTDGQAMKDEMGPFLQILFDANPKSIGGKLPDDAFYYAR